ncbi:DNA-binding response regulator [Streptomyces sp. CBMA123]|uniref:response regulator transcription factor n=1 Tax=Streptomyces sp. CBMA123 TaxID=1896313 RepID=UPI001661D759|nr:response regulator transcription factor [Streptomyces sp. CBMA123]MBD0690539.1 DNA-binding response regulator [Streptomyces sp. CBMA123]
MIRILLAEDMRILRGALVALLTLEEDLEVVAEVATGNGILAAALEHRPDVAVIDVNLPGLDGITAARQVRTELPGCRTLILTALDQPGMIRRAMDAGVHGYLLKDAPPSELTAAIRTVAGGRRVIDPQLAVALWDRGQNPLTPRETDVLARASAGEEAVDIAGQLHLSVGTVRNYLTTAVVKLSARNRLDAVRIARDNGWIP